MAQTAFRAAREIDMSTLFPPALPGLPFVTEEQMREVDRAMIDDYGVTLLQMMENAGRNAATVARERFFAGEPAGKTVLMLAGPGGNGGGGLSAGRHLHNKGARVEVILSAAEDRLGDAPGIQLRTLRQESSDIVSHCFWFYLQLPRGLVGLPGLVSESPYPPACGRVGRGSGRGGSSRSLKSKF